MPSGQRRELGRQTTFPKACETRCVSRARRIGNLVGVIAPFVGTVAAIVLLWHEAVDQIDLTLMLVAYVLTGLGITVGYHRLLTHRAFNTYKPVEYVLA